MLWYSVLTGWRTVDRLLPTVRVHMATRNSFLGDDGRRARRRFPIERDVRYQCVKGGRIISVGVGKTIEIGSRYVLFSTQEFLKAGQKIRLSVDWPAMLDNTCRMQLEIAGWVVLSEAQEAAVKIERYEFRTRGAALAVMHS